MKIFIIILFLIEFLINYLFKLFSAIREVTLGTLGEIGA